MELAHSLGLDTRSTLPPCDGAENSCAQSTPRRARIRAEEAHRPGIDRRELPVRPTRLRSEVRYLPNSASTLSPITLALTRLRACLQLGPQRICARPLVTHRTIARWVGRSGRERLEKVDASFVANQHIDIDLPRHSVHEVRARTVVVVVIVFWIHHLQAP